MTAVISTSCENLQSGQCNKEINLDFGPQRRRSFLPDSWTDEDRVSTIKNVGVLEVHEEDDLFMYMHRSSQSNHEKPMEKFSTGSKYFGEWNRLGISGKGVYKYPHGAIYDGYFNRNGEFHGTGILVYPNGQRIEGIWKNGKLVDDCNFIAPGGIVMSKAYCLMPDRRFQVEVENDFNPAGQEYLTDELPPPREIPDDCYDLVEGYYDPVIKAVVNYPVKKRKRSTLELSEERRASTRYIFSGDEKRQSAFHEVYTSSVSDRNLARLMKRDHIETNKTISWIPSKDQEQWIIKNCRKSFDEPIGYRPDLYEEWMKGGKNKSAEFETEAEPDSKCKLRTLNLHKPEAKSSTSRITSFVVTNRDKESVTADMLSKMFTGSHEARNNMDIKMFAAARVDLQSEEQFAVAAE